MTTDLTSGPSIKFDLEKNDKEQAELALKARLSDKSVLRAKAVIKDLEHIPHFDLSDKQKKQLTDAYARTGRYKDAYVLSGDEIYLAIDKADSTECDCKDFSTHILKDGRPHAVTYTRWFHRNFYKGNDQVLTCSECGHMKI